MWAPSKCFCNRRFSRVSFPGELGCVCCAIAMPCSDKKRMTRRDFISDFRFAISDFRYCPMSDEFLFHIYFLHVEYFVANRDCTEAAHFALIRTFHFFAWHFPPTLVGATLCFALIVFLIPQLINSSFINSKPGTSVQFCSYFAIPTYVGTMTYSSTHQLIISSIHQS